VKHLDGGNRLIRLPPVLFDDAVFKGAGKIAEGPNVVGEIYIQTIPGGTIEGDERHVDVETAGCLLRHASKFVKRGVAGVVESGGERVEFARLILPVGSDDV